MILRRTTTSIDLLLQTQSFFGCRLVIQIVDGVFEILKLDIVGLGVV